MSDNYGLWLLLFGLAIAAFIYWRLALRTNGKSWKCHSDAPADLIGKTGIALTFLRPSGIAKIEGLRKHVITGGMQLKRERS